jgi:hypothetical protein
MRTRKTPHNNRLATSLFTQIQLNISSGPGCYPITKQVLVFGPDGAIEQQRGCHDWPVPDISRSHSLPCKSLMLFIETLVHDFDETR